MSIYSCDSLVNSGNLLHYYEKNTAGNIQASKRIIELFKSGSNIKRNIAEFLNITNIVGMG